MRSPREHQCRNVQAFTLVELLTVIVVIAILTSLLLPALTKAKGRVQTLACINNLKELEGSCHLYTSDFNDYLPPNNPITLTTLANGARAVSAMNYDSWCPGMAPTDINTVNLSQGLIFPYNRSPFIYNFNASKAFAVRHCRVSPGKGGRCRWRGGGWGGPLQTQMPWLRRCCSKQRPITHDPKSRPRRNPVICK